MRVALSSDSNVSPRMAFHASHRSFLLLDRESDSEKKKTSGSCAELSADIILHLVETQLCYKLDLLYINYTSSERESSPTDDCALTSQDLE